MGRRFRSAASAGSSILAADIAELRTFIDQDYGGAFPPPHPPFPWSWTNVVAGERILAKHFKEMRDAIQELWTFKGRGPIPMWSSGTNPGGESLGTAPTRILASDLTDLRVWLNQYEDNHPPGDQGIDSFSYDPTAGAVITPSWAQDLLAMALDKPLFVRANVKARDNNDLPDNPDVMKYREAFNHYKDKNLRVFALFTLEFWHPAGVDRSDPLEADFANEYIRGFSNRASIISTDLHNNAGVDDYIIWNEPNVQGPCDAPLDAEHFAALLYRCWNDMVNVPRVYWGGVQFGPGPEPKYEGEPDPNALDYIANVYEALRTRSLAGEGKPWPWSGINIHIHDERSDYQLNRIHEEVDAIMIEKGDPGDLVVGEWGVTQEQQTEPPIPPHDTPLSGLFNGIKPWASVMFFFKHGNHSPSPGITWGIHAYSVQSGQYVIGSPTNLHDPLDTLLGS